MPHSELHQKKRFKNTMLAFALVLFMALIVATTMIRYTQSPVAQQAYERNTTSEQDRGKE